MYIHSYLYWFILMYFDVTYLGKDCSPISNCLIRVCNSIEKRQRFFHDESGLPESFWSAIFKVFDFWVPHGLGHDEWLQALPRGLVAGFIKTDKEFQRKGQTSGAMATFVIVDRWTVTASGGEVGRLSIMGGAEIG